MIFILLALSIVAFVLYFYIIGLWYLWLIPIFALLAFIIYYISGISFKEKTNNLFKNYWLFLAWIVVQLGIFFILKFFAVAIPNSFLFLIGLNLLLWLLSYVFTYKDGKKIAELAYYTIITTFLVYILSTQSVEVFFTVFSYFWLLNTAVVAFIVFVLSIFFDVEEYVSYKFFILFLWAIFIVLYFNIDNIYLFLIIITVWLGIIYFFIHKILSIKLPTEMQIKELSVRRILAWERVLSQKPSFSKFSQSTYSFVSAFPNFVKYSLEFANTFVVLALIYLYFKNALVLQWGIDHLFYWLIMVWFIVNVYLLKRINYTSTIQRLLTFLIINFAIYLSLFSAFDGDLWWIMFLAIMRNILSTVMVFYIHKTKIAKYLRKVDYLFWIFSTLLALVVNITLLFQVELAWQLLFPLVLLYVWIQGMAMYYAIKYINKIQEVEEQIDY